MSNDDRSKTYRNDAVIEQLEEFFRNGGMPEDLPEIIREAWLAYCEHLKGAGLDQLRVFDK
jgi:hypothetical protein